jgi:hypothetical protein
MLALALLSTSASASTLCRAKFGFSEWKAALDETTQELSVFQPGSTFKVVGRYATVERKGEKAYFVGYGYNQGVSLTSRAGGFVLCLDANTCSPCQAASRVIP